MLSFNDMKSIYNNAGSIGQQLKVMADDAMQATFDNDIATRQCYIYDYYHDDDADKEYGYDPSLSKNKIPVKLKFIIKEYKSVTKNDPEYHIMFEPDVWNSMSCKPDWFVKQYESLQIQFPIGLYCDIPDDRGIYHRWIITYTETANQFPRFGVLKCNYLFKWVIDDGMNRYKRKVWGIERAKTSGAGISESGIFTMLDSQKEIFFPWTPITSELKHDMRLFISMIQKEPYVYKISHVENTSPKGIIKLTLMQDRYDINRDYVSLDVLNEDYGDMYADYYSSVIVPEETTAEVETNTDILTLTSASRSVRINGGTRIITAKITDVDGSDITSKYDKLAFNWRFAFKDTYNMIDHLIAVDSDYGAKSGNEYKCKFKFLGDEQHLNGIITVSLDVGSLTSSVDLNIIS